MPDNWSILEKYCKKLGLPKPELRKKMWVTIADIPGYYSGCNPDSQYATHLAIRWCQTRPETYYIG